MITFDWTKGEGFDPVTGEVLSYNDESPLDVQVANARADLAGVLYADTLPVDDAGTLPLIGHAYEDARGRRLKVDALNIGSPGGREVLGELTAAQPLHGEPEGRSGAYSTTLPTWAAIWRDKAPPLDPSKAKIG